MKAYRVVPLLALALLLPALALFGCGSKQNPLTPESTSSSPATVPQEVLQELAQLRAIAATDDRGVLFHRNAASAAAVGRGPILVPAGSVDALQAAVASAGPSGIVILESGVHTEHTTVTISQRVSIIGETGAVLESGVTHSNDLPSTFVRPALYVHNVSGVTIWNLAMKPIGTVAGTAILLENAPRTTVGWNTITDFQYGVLIHYAEASNIVGNTVVANPGWMVGDLVDAGGIINMNGARTRIADNDISQGLLNAFCSGVNGFYLSNRSHDGFVGMILCCVPEGAFTLPSGAVVGSDISGASWVVHGNEGSNNFYAGILVIDGANRNHLANNGGSGNGVYDIEMLGTTCLFGFETPTSFDNTLVIGSVPGLTINDFGQNNSIIGSATVTHDLTAPCAKPAPVMTRLLRARSGS